VFTVAFRGVDLTVLRNLVNFDGGYSSSRIQTIVVVLSMAIVLCDRLHHCDFYQIAVKPFVGLQGLALVFYEYTATATVTIRPTVIPAEMP